MARNLIKFYEIFQNKPSDVTFEEVCDRYLRANLEVIERDIELADRVNEIQTEYGNLGEEKFMSKYGMK